MGFWWQREDRRERAEPREQLHRRVSKDRFTVSYCWLLAVDLLVAVGFAVGDLYTAAARGGWERAVLHRIFQSGLTAAVVVGVVIVAAGMLRLRGIRRDPTLPGRRLCLGGMLGAGFLALALLILWLITG